MRYLILVIGFILITSTLSAETVRVVYKPDRSVAIIIPSKGGDYETKVLDCMKSDNLQGLPYDDIDSSQLPIRENRNAWEGEKGQPITINPAKIQPKPKTAEERLLKLEQDVEALK